MVNVNEDIATHVSHFASSSMQTGKKGVSCHEEVKLYVSVLENHDFIRINVNHVQCLNVQYTCNWNKWSLRHTRDSRLQRFCRRGFVGTGRPQNKDLQGMGLEVSKIVLQKCWGKGGSLGATATPFRTTTNTGWQLVVRSCSCRKSFLTRNGIGVYNLTRKWVWGERKESTWKSSHFGETL